MPLFTPQPETMEARQYVGGEPSTTEIMGWISGTNGSTPEHDEAVGEEGDENYRPERIVWDGGVVYAGQWLMHREGYFLAMEASELYSQYRQL